MFICKYLRSAQCRAWITVLEDNKIFLEKGRKQEQELLHILTDNEIVHVVIVEIRAGT